MITCKECNKDFKLITNSHLLKQHSMSPDEYLAKHPGSSLLDEGMRQKIIESRYHVYRPKCAKLECEQIVTQSWNKYCSYECAAQVRAAEGRNSVTQRGPGNPNYTDGNYSLGKRQKKLARERDNYKCSRCKKHVEGKEAHVHHKIPERCFDNLHEAHDLSNLVTLCESCHPIVENKLIYEFYKRAQQLDEICKNDKNHVTLEQFVEDSIKTEVA